MAIADTAKLVVDLSLKGNFVSQVKASEGALRGLGSRITSVQGRAYKAGQQIGVGIQRTALLGVAAVGALVPLLVKIAKEGQDAANVEAIFAKAVSNSGKVSLANVAALRAQEAALLKLGGVDDELIKSEQTRLVQMGLTGDQILKITPLILDFSKATGIDLLTATKLAGKSVEGNIGALSRYGVQIDKAKAKVDPFAATVDALNHKFGGTTAALSGSLNTKLSVLHEELKNVEEEAGQKLLPVMTRLVDIIGSRVVPAFGKFLDAILPRAITGLNKLGDALESGAGAQTVTRIIDTIQSLLPAIESGAKITGQVIATAVHLFESLPPEIQSLAIAGLAVNKLTGGLVTNIAGGLIGTVVTRLFSALKSAVVNVNGAVVNVNGLPGGLPGGPVGAAEEGLTASALIKGGIKFALPIAAGIAIANAIKAVAGVTDEQQQFQQTHGQFGPRTATQAPKIDFSALANANAREDRGLLSGAVTQFAGKIKDDTAGLPQLLKAVAAEWRDAAQRLAHHKSNAELASAAKAITKLISTGRGGAEQTAHALASLEKQLAHTHDPKLQAALRADIAKVQGLLPGRQFAAKEYANAQKILSSHESENKKIVGLQEIERALKDRGLPHAASVIAAKIAAAQRATTVAQHSTTQAIKDKDLSVTAIFNANISVRDSFRAQRSFTLAGNLRGK